MEKLLRVNFDVQVNGTDLSIITTQWNGEPIRSIKTRVNGIERTERVRLLDGLTKTGIDCIPKRFNGKADKSVALNYKSMQWKSTALLSQFIEMERTSPVRYFYAISKKK